MTENTCKNCAHFYQHYVYFLEQRYEPIPCGHCVYPRLKYRTPETLSCIHFQKKTKETVPKP